MKTLDGDVRDGRRVLLGRIVGVLAVRGELKIESWTEPRMRIFDYQPWLLETAPGVVKEIGGVQGRAQGKGMVASLPGVDDRENAAALIGAKISVRVRRCRRLQGEYYWVDLEGLEVVTTEGVSLGQVESPVRHRRQRVLVVRDEDGARAPDSFRAGCRMCGRWILTAGRIVVDWDPRFLRDGDAHRRRHPVSRLRAAVCCRRRGGQGARSAGCCRWKPGIRATTRPTTHRSVDDRTFGGGPGMVMMIEPLRSDPGRPCARRRRKRRH